MKRHNESKIPVYGVKAEYAVAVERKILLTVLINTEDVKSPRSAFALCLKNPFIHLN